jgi:Fe-S-cluster containining protein
VARSAQASGQGARMSVRVRKKGKPRWQQVRERSRGATPPDPRLIAPIAGDTAETYWARYMRLVGTAMRAAGATTMKDGGMAEVARLGAEVRTSYVFMRELHLPVLPGASDPTACRSGCDACCNLEVAILVPELFRIARHIRTHFSEADVGALLVRLALLAKGTKEMDSAQRSEAALPCALLVGSRCSVYTVRPTSCLSCSSYSRQACEEGRGKSNHPIPMPALDSITGRAVQGGVAQGMWDVGLRTPMVELTRGLLVALTEKDPFTRWLQGEPVFEGALIAGYREAEEAWLAERAVARAEAEAAAVTAAPPDSPQGTVTT